MTKPFHESIVDALKNAAFKDHLFCLGRLIKETNIPANHEAILEAWLASVNWVLESETLVYIKKEVEEHIRQQKAEAEEKAAAEIRKHPKHDIS